MKRESGSLSFKGILQVLISIINDSLQSDSLGSPTLLYTEIVRLELNIFLVEIPLLYCIFSN